MFCIGSVVFVRANLDDECPLLLPSVFVHRSRFSLSRCFWRCMSAARLGSETIAWGWELVWEIRNTNKSYIYQHERKWKLSWLCFSQQTLSKWPLSSSALCKRGEIVPFALTPVSAFRAETLQFSSVLNPDPADLHLNITQLSELVAYTHSCMSHNCAIAVYFHLRLWLLIQDAGLGEWSMLRRSAFPFLPYLSLESWASSAFRDGVSLVKGF